MSKIKSLYNKYIVLSNIINNYNLEDNELCLLIDLKNNIIKKASKTECQSKNDIQLKINIFNKDIKEYNYELSNESINLMNSILLKDFQNLYK